ncbi:hypothetical protein DA100_02675 [Vibrio sp. Hep-1b-8]|nr:hypothetical protein DA100_02675 [Vibrio sp. Hep-1b-8]
MILEVLADKVIPQLRLCKANEKKEKASHQMLRLAVTGTVAKISARYGHRIREGSLEVTADLA